MAYDYDAIIGTGFGGTVAAVELGRQPAQEGADPGTGRVVVQPGKPATAVGSETVSRSRSSTGRGPTTPRASSTCWPP
jgi:hypothetical protein